MKIKLFLPEAGHDERKDGKYFQTSDQHEEAKNIFSGGRGVDEIAGRPETPQSDAVVAECRNRRPERFVERHACQA